MEFRVVTAKLTIKAKSVMAAALSRSGVLTANFGRRAGSGFVLLAYNRSIERKDQREHVQDGMFVDPKTFDSHIRFLKEHFRLEPMRALTLPAPAYGDRRPVCCLTFDDGWVDFYEHAYPVLKEHRVPATVFLATDFIGTGRCMWPDRISRIIQKRNDSPARVAGRGDSIDPIVSQLEKIGGTRRRQSESAIGILKNHRLDRIERVISELSDRWEYDDRPPERDFLSWGEIREMLSSGFIAFGSHTAGHPILTTLQVGEIEREMDKSKNVLIGEGVVDPGFIPFCYPNGNYDENILGLVAKAGYHMAVTTEKGWNAHVVNNSFRLRRISIHQDIGSTTPLLGCRIAGIL